jgi:hypothetical protein
MKKRLEPKFHLMRVEDVREQLSRLEAQDFSYSEVTNLDWYIPSSVTKGVDWAVCGYLLSDEAVLRKGAAVALHFANEHFFGSWRSTYRVEGKLCWTSEAEARKELDWMEPFRQAATACAVVGSWEELKKLSGYLTSGPLPPDKGGYGQLGPDDEVYYKEMARLIGGKPGRLKPGDPFKGKRVTDREKLLREAIHALRRKDRDTFDRVLVSYLEHFVAKECDHELLFDREFCLDGTLLYHLGRRRMGDEVGSAIPERLRRWVVRMPEPGAAPIALTAKVGRTKVKKGGSK